MKISDITEGSCYWRPTEYQFEPAEDVTAYEVAMLLRHVVSVSEKFYDSLPDEAKRHFKLKES